MKLKKKINELSKEEREKAAEWVKSYLDREFDLEAGRLQAALMADYLAEHMGPFFYNNGVRDAITFMEEKTEDMVLLLLDTVE